MFMTLSLPVAFESHCNIDLSCFLGTTVDQNICINLSLFFSLFLPTLQQVMETGLKKKMEEVKEIFSSCTEVFQELLTVRAHLVQRIDACRAAIQRIHSSVGMLSADDTSQLQQLLQVLLQGNGEGIEASENSTCKLGSVAQDYFHQHQKCDRIHDFIQFKCSLTATTSVHDTNTSTIGSLYVVN